MNIGIVLNCYPCPLAEQITLMKKYGFSATFAMSDRADLSDAVSACREAGIEMESFHAPARDINLMWDVTDAGDARLRSYFADIDACRLHGVPVLAMHPSHLYPAPRVNDRGLMRFERLFAYAKENGVTVAIENVRTIGNIAVLLEEFPDAAFCWDVGHESAYTAGREYMPLFGHRIAALHLHDNRGIDNNDEHLIPFDGRINFDRVAKSLAEANYRNSLMLELHWYSHSQYGRTDAETYYARAARAATVVAEKVEAFRSML